MSKRNWVPVVVTAGVVALAMQADHESPGAAGRAATSAREATTPIVSEIFGFLGDILLIGRDEASRQGIDPTRVFKPADGAGELQPPDPQDSPAPLGGGN